MDVQNFEAYYICNFTNLLVMKFIINFNPYVNIKILKVTENLIIFGNRIWEWNNFNPYMDIPNLIC